MGDNDSCRTFRSANLHLGNRIVWRRTIGLDADGRDSTIAGIYAVGRESKYNGLSNSDNNKLQLDVILNSRRRVRRSKRNQWNEWNKRKQFYHFSGCSGLPKRKLCSWSAIRNHYLHLCNWRIDGRNDGELDSHTADILNDADIHDTGDLHRNSPSDNDHDKWRLVNTCYCGAERHKRHQRHDWIEWEFCLYRRGVSAAGKRTRSTKRRVFQFHHISADSPDVMVISTAGIHNDANLHGEVYLLRDRDCSRRDMDDSSYCCSEW